MRTFLYDPKHMNGNELLKKIKKLAGKKGKTLELHTAKVATQH